MCGTDAASSIGIISRQAVDHIHSAAGFRDRHAGLLHDVLDHHPVARGQFAQQPRPFFGRLGGVHGRQIDPLAEPRFPDRVVLGAVEEGEDVRLGFAPMGEEPRDERRLGSAGARVEAAIEGDDEFGGGVPFGDRARWGRRRCGR